MTEAWFSPETSRYFAFLSLLALCAIFDEVARRGRLRHLVLGVWNVVIGISVVIAGSGAVAFLTGQPAYVVRTLVMSGMFVGATFALTRVLVVQTYREAELRKTIANDI